MRDAAALHRIRLGIDRPRVEEALDEPGRRAVGEALELGHREGRREQSCSSTSGCVRRVGRRKQRGALEPPLPAVGAGERIGRRGIAAASSASARNRSRSVGASSSGHVSAESGRRRVQRRTSSASNSDWTSCQNGSPRAGCHRRPPPRARDRAAAKRAYTPCRRGSDRAQPGLAAPASRLFLEPAPRPLVEERRARAATRQAPLLQAEDEDCVEASRASTPEVDDGHAPRVVPGGRAQRGTLDRREDLVAAQLPAELAPALELASSRSAPRARRSNLLAASAGGRSRPYASRTFAPQLPHGLDRILGVAQLGERRQGAPRSRSPRRRHAPAPGPARPRSRPSTKSTDLRSSPRERRTQKPEGRRAFLLPHAKRSRAARACMRGVRASRSRCRSRTGCRTSRAPSRAAPRIRSYPGTTSPIRSGDMPARASASTSSPTSSSVPRLPAPSKKRITPSSGGASPGSSAKSAPLEMRERRRRHRLVARRQLLDGAGSEAGEILGRAPQRCEHRPSRLVGKRNGDLGARGQRLEQGPLSAGQILEAVREDRLAAPGVEVGTEAFDSVVAQQAAVPALEPVELARGSSRRETRARLSPRPARGVPRRARRAPARGSRRIRYARRSGQSRRAVCCPRPGERGAPAPLVRAADELPASRPRGAGTDRRR